VTTARIERVEVTTACETGATHVRRNQGCDDAVGWSDLGDGPLVATVAIADGHSDPRCVRSRTGADFVVAAAAAIPVTALSAQAVTGALVAGWRHRVDCHLAEHPLASADLADPDGAQAEESTAAWAVNARVAYGTTALVCRITHDVITIVQVGDGDVIAVTADGHARRLAVAQGSKGDVTESISQSDAEVVARCAEISADAAPILLMLATDGFDNAYPAEESMLRAAGELASLRRDSGQPIAPEVLTRWAREAAEVSGDDATVAAVWIETAPRAGRTLTR
jgi:serine/threonine protein phosphatase PrpC